VRDRGQSLPALAVLAALLAIAGCGGGAGADDAPPSRTVTVEGPEPVEVIARDYSFDPSTIVASDGADPLELRLVNQGAVAHNLRVFDGASEVGGTPTFPGGESESASIELEPGSYRMVCTVANHEELGMVGDLEVR
jgi:plastocyanin